MFSDEDCGTASTEGEVVVERRYWPRNVLASKLTLIIEARTSSPEEPGAMPLPRKGILVELVDDACGAGPLRKVVVVAPYIALLSVSRAGARKYANSVSGSRTRSSNARAAARSSRNCDFGATLLLRKEDRAPPGTASERVRALLTSAWHAPRAP